MGAEDILRGAACAAASCGRDAPPATPRRRQAPAPARQNTTERCTTDGTGRNLPQKWGLWLTIQGDVRFLSHRDSLRLVVRAAVRARLPVAYTRGFNPHPILSLPSPRPVAVASRGELVVLDLTEPVGAGEIVERMNRHVARGMTFTGARPLARGERPQPRRIRYDWPIPPGQGDRLREKVAAFVAAERWPVERQPSPKRRGRAAAARTIDLKQLVETLAVEGPGLSWTLVPSGDIWARPAEVLDALGLDGPVDLASAVRTQVNYELSDPPGARQGPSPEEAGTNP